MFYLLLISLKHTKDENIVNQNCIYQETMWLMLLKIIIYFCFFCFALLCFLLPVESHIRGLPITKVIQKKSYSLLWYETTRKECNLHNCTVPWKDHRVWYLSVWMSYKVAEGGVNQSWRTSQVAKKEAEINKQSFIIHFTNLSTNTLHHHMYKLK